MPLVTLPAIIGGNLRVGLGDSRSIAKGQLARSNADQLLEVRYILEQFSLEIARPDEARQMLSLKGRVTFAF